MADHDQALFIATETGFNFNQFYMLFDRELCSKVLKEAFLLFLLFLFFLVAWNHEQKMFQMEQKVFANKKCSELDIKCAKEQKMFL